MPLNIPTTSHTALRRYIRELDSAPGANPPIMTWGEPGIGKTQLWRQVAEELDMEFVTVLLNQKGPGDVGGLLCPDQSTGKSVAYLPEWLPSKDDGRTLVLFDEFGTCPEMIRKSVLELLLEGRIGPYAMDAKHWCVAASNTGDDGVLNFSLDPATADRFQHFRLGPDFESWKAWSLENDVDGTVLAFLESSSDAFSGIGDPNLEKMTVIPSPRSWSRLSDSMGVIERLGEGEALSAVSAHVGERTAVRFMSFRREATGMAKVLELVAMDRSERARAMPTTRPGVQSLAWSLPAVAVRGRDEALAAMHIATLVHQAKGSKGRAMATVQETACMAVHSIMSRLVAKRPDILEAISGSEDARRAESLMSLSAASAAALSAGRGASAADAFEAAMREEEA